MKSLFSRNHWKTLFHTVSHPADGYYWIRHQDTGSVWIAVLLVALFSLSFSINRMYASFVVNPVNPRSVSSLQELGGVLLLYLMLCVGNWSVTCLMDGEGRFKDIVVAIGYAMFPLIVTFNLATLVSQIVAENEEGFYSHPDTFGHRLRRDDDAHGRDAGARLHAWAKRCSRCC